MVFVAIVDKVIFQISLEKLKEENRLDYLRVSSTYILNYYNRFIVIEHYLGNLLKSHSNINS